MQVEIDPVLFFEQASLGLLHVLGDRICGNELFRLAAVVCLGRGQEGLLECFAVHVEVLPIGIDVVQAESDK